MASQTGRQIITILILLDFSRGKHNQTLKSGYLKEQKMKNIFIKKSCTKSG